MRECFTDDDSSPSSCILWCNEHSNASVLTYSNNDCSETRTEKKLEEFEFGVVNCYEGSCFVVRFNVYKNLNDTNCNDQNINIHTFL